MRYVRLGRTDLRVSALALGCWPFAGGSVWGAQRKEDSLATVRAALDRGINFFDTAYAYEAGASERVLGEALKPHRPSVVIATKLGGSEAHPDRIRAACRRSLRNLQIDCIDLYQIHWPAWDIPVSDAVGALQELRTLGWIRHFAVCNYGPRDFSALAALTAVPSNQLPYSLLARTIEREILPLCRAQGTGVIGYSPLAQGLLTGRYASADAVPAGLARTRHFAGRRPQARHDEAGCETEVFAALQAIRAIADDMGLSMAVLALAWLLQQPGVASLLIGARTPTELARNLPALEVPLSRDVAERLDVATRPVKARLGSNVDLWMAASRIR